MHVDNDIEKECGVSESVEKDVACVGVIADLPKCRKGTTIKSTKALGIYICLYRKMPEVYKLN